MREVLKYQGRMDERFRCGKLICRGLKLLDLKMAMVVSIASGNKQMHSAMWTVRWRASVPEISREGLKLDVNLGQTLDLLLRTSVLLISHPNSGWRQL